jgi:hypothetical protein
MRASPDAKSLVCKTKTGPCTIIHCVPDTEEPTLQRWRYQNAPPFWLTGCRAYHESRHVSAAHIATQGVAAGGTATHIYVIPEVSWNSEKSSRKGS